ncbi:MAG: flagella basal body P-ring formation protein FlgA [Silvanigrellaceae bacterium]|nr:flagella basal body P-ring formation protein FlgA [Silvanigrellaceae bacterium]
MILSPPQVYVEYKDLSKDEGIAEIQKDFIVQIIKLNKQNDTIVIDKIMDSNNDNLFIAHCIQCNLPNLSFNEIIYSTIKKNKNNFSSEYIFEIKNDTNNKITWKIQLKEKKKIYYLAAKQNISINSILNEKDIDILSCTTEESKCSPNHFYLSNKEAENSILNFKNKKSSNQIRVGQEIDPKWLSQEILIHTGEKTKVTYSPNRSLIIQTFGKSLSNAGRGETIRVQISDWFDKSSVLHPTGIIEGIVIAPGEVEYATK